MKPHNLTQFLVQRHNKTSLLQPLSFTSGGSLLSKSFLCNGKKNSSRWKTSLASNRGKARKSPIDHLYIGHPVKLPQRRQPTPIAALCTYATGGEKRVGCLFPDPDDARAPGIHGHAQQKQPKGSRPRNYGGGLRDHGSNGAAGGRAP